MGKAGATGLRRILNAWGYSMAGLRAAFVNEAAFRQEVALAVLLIPIACWLNVSAVERVLLIGSVLLVLIVELLNSALEALCDQVSDLHQPLIGRAKDIGSAAVWVALVTCALTWCMLLLPRLL